MNEILEAIKWFFGLQMDSVTLPWAEANKYTIAFLLGAPVMAARWYWKTRHQAKLAANQVSEGEDGSV